jgi:ABC-type multidrug transport system fused ATPase/permease subunit
MRRSSGSGAYTVGILFTHHASGIPLWGFIPGANQLLITLPAAVLLAGIAAAAIGALSLRTGGVQFIMITLAFAQMMFFFFVALKSYGGEDGIIIRRTNEFLGLNMRDRTTLYYVILGIAALFFAGLWRVVNSSFGAVLAGLRQNERRMAALGFAPYRYKLYAFVLAGMGAGLAGALMANYLRFVSPDMMHWTKSGELMIMVILGGVGSFLWPAVRGRRLPDAGDVPGRLVGTLAAGAGPHSAGGGAGHQGRDRGGWIAQDHRGAWRMTPILEIEGITKRFGGLVATDNVSLTVMPGEIHALIGPNGAGKSTLINQLCGELVPNAGRIRLAGQDITRLPVPDRVALGLGRTFQITNL